MHGGVRGQIGINYLIPIFLLDWELTIMVTFLGIAYINHTSMKTQKKVLVLKAPLTYILINEDRDSERAKEKWLLNREMRLNPPVDKKGK